MLRVGACVTNLFQFADKEFQFLILVVEMRRDANAGAGPEVHDKFAAHEFVSDGGGVFVGDGYRAAALGGVFRAGNGKALFFGQFDEALRLALAFLADAFDADLIDDFVTRLRRVKRGNGGRTVQKAGDALSFRNWA